MGTKVTYVIDASEDVLKRLWQRDEPLELRETKRKIEPEGIYEIAVLDEKGEEIGILAYDATKMIRERKIPVEEICVERYEVSCKEYTTSQYNSVYDEEGGHSDCDENIPIDEEIVEIYQCKVVLRHALLGRMNMQMRKQIMSEEELAEYLAQQEKKKRQRQIRKELEMQYAEEIERRTEERRQEAERQRQEAERQAEIRRTEEAAAEEEMKKKTRMVMIFGMTLIVSMIALCIWGYASFMGMLLGW